MFRIYSRGLCSFLFPDFVPGWFVLRLLRWCSAVSSCFPAFSGLADPCHFYSPALSLLLCSWRLCSSCFLFLAFGGLGWLLVLSPYPWSTRSFCWSVPTLPSCSVGPPGSPRLALPLRSGVLLPGCTCSVFGLYRFGFLPFLLLRCLPAWWLFPLGGLLLFRCIRSLVPRSSTVVL